MPMTWQVLARFIIPDPKSNIVLFSRLAKDCCASMPAFHVATVKALQPAARPRVCAASISVEALSSCDIAIASSDNFQQGPLLSHRQQAATATSQSRHAGCIMGRMGRQTQVC